MVEKSRAVFFIYTRDANCMSDTSNHGHLQACFFHTNLLISLLDYLIEKEEYSDVSLNALNKFIAYCIAIYVSCYQISILN